MRQCKHIRKLEDRGPAMIPKLHSFTHSFIHPADIPWTLAVCHTLVWRWELLRWLSLHALLRMLTYSPLPCDIPHEALPLCYIIWPSQQPREPLLLNLHFSDEEGAWGSETKQHQKRPKASLCLQCVLVSMNSSSRRAHPSSKRSESRGKRWTQLCQSPGLMRVSCSGNIEARRPRCYFCHQLSVRPWAPLLLSFPNWREEGPWKLQLWDLITLLIQQAWLLEVHFEGMKWWESQFQELAQQLENRESRPPGGKGDKVRPWALRVTSPSSAAVTLLPVTAL